MDQEPVVAFRFSILVYRKSEKNIHMTIFILIFPDLSEKFSGE
jgi:hypothetical protein